VIGESDALDVAGVKRVVMCSGKVYYDLLEARRARGLTDVAILRLEQIYPFPRDQFAAALAPYTAATQFIWCQEEPQNQGAWDQIKHRFHRLLADNRQVCYAGRAISAAPAAATVTSMSNSRSALSTRPSLASSTKNKIAGSRYDNHY
jgi:2-oxoglutarate dehydrogenase E1 component